jgi:hypothetical protein
MLRPSKLYSAVIATLGVLSSLMYGFQSPDATGMWIAKGSMAAARSGACAASLPDGRVLITGGQGPTGSMNTAEIFTADGSFSAAAGMAGARSGHSCATLEDGQILVAGGSNEFGAVSTAEVFDPAVNRWAPAGNMVSARSGHTATVLRDGRVLIAGGQGAATVYDTLEIFDPAANSFQSLSPAALASPRELHAAALLPDGRVLIAGGANGSRALASSDVFDPRTGAVTRGPNLSAARAGVSATTLLDGRVLIAGGSDDSQDLATAELYNPETGSFSLAGRMTETRRGQIAVLLPHNNQVLLIGGDRNGTSAEVFTPWRGTFRPTGNLDQVRSGAVASPVGADGVLVLAGGRSGSATLQSSRTYRFATLKTDQAQYEPGATATITGSGWQPGEQVNLLVQQKPALEADRNFTATANANGDITTQVKAAPQPGSVHLVTATAAQSTSQTSFAANVSATLSQCANGALFSLGPPPVSGQSCSWVSGNVNASKASYLEGSSVAYRMQMGGLVNGSSHSLTIAWASSQTGKHALDYLTTYNSTVGLAHPCDGTTGCSGSGSTFPIPTDLALSGGSSLGTGMVGGRWQLLGPSTGNLTIWGGTITSITGLSYSGSFSGTSSTQITINFTASASNPVIAWGGHIATHTDWGTGNSAVSISGSPFHTSLVGLDGSGGAQDRALATGAVIFPATIYIVKQANATGTFPFTSSPSPNSTSSTSTDPFSLINTGDCTATSTTCPMQTYLTVWGVNDVLPTTYTFTETSQAGWTTTGISCSVIGTGTWSSKLPTTAAATITLNQGDITTCTFTNSIKAHTVTLTKATVPLTDKGSFTLTIDDADGHPVTGTVGNGGSISKIVTAVPTVTLSEIGQSNYTSSLACTGATPISGSFVMPDNDVACTLTNTRAQHNVIVNKVLVPSTDGGVFSVTINDTTNTSSKTGQVSNAGGLTISWPVYGGASVTVS